MLVLGALRRLPCFVCSLLRQAHFESAILANVPIRNTLIQCIPRVCFCELTVASHLLRVTYRDCVTELFLSAGALATSFGQEAKLFVIWNTTVHQVQLSKILYACLCPLCRFFCIHICGGKCCRGLGRLPGRALRTSSSTTCMHG